MTKKLNIKSFLKEKRFYVILFISLCVMGVAAIITSKNGVENNKQETNLKIEQNKEIAQNQENSQTDYKDAELVKDVETDKVEEFAVEESEDKSVETSATPSELFINPVINGVVTRNYDITPRINEEKTSAVVYKGIDIETVLGAEVKSIADGKVIDAGKGDSKEGYYVVVEHEDGFTSTYANLDEDLEVSVGDSVTQGTTLGKVGNTIQNNPDDRVSEEYLLFHMEKSKEPINPIEYINGLNVE